MNSLLTKVEFLKRLKVAISLYLLNFDPNPQTVSSNGQRIELAIKAVTDSMLPSSPDGLDPITRAVLSIGRTKVTAYCTKDTIDVMIVIEEAWVYLTTDEGAYIRFKELNL